MTKVQEQATGMVERSFSPGDRVRLRAAEAEGFLQPWRRFAHEGRMATVTSVGALVVWCEFDVKRAGAKPHRMDFRSRDLEPLPALAEGGE